MPEPDEGRTKWFEVWVAAVGVLVTAVLGYGQWRLGVQQNEILENQRKAAERRAVDEIEVQVMSLVSPHLGRMVESGTEGHQAQSVVLAAAEYLSSAYGRTSLAAMAAKISEGEGSVREDVRVRIQEATVPPPLRTPWYTVLASLPGDDLKRAQSVANEKHELARKVGLSESIWIYKTRVSGVYAVVIGGPLDKDDALALAARARASGLAHDAFSQEDRSWSTVGQAPFR